jgi:NAD(P)H-flavin reductase
MALAAEAPAPLLALADPMRPRPFRVQRVVRENADTFTLALAPVAGTAPCAFAPGQFNMLYVFGVGEIPISISGDPRQPEAFLHTTRVVGAVTKALCHLPRGAMVGLRGPFGRGWPVAEAAGQDVVLVAGGIGLAPLRPAVYELLANRDRYGKVVLLYGTRSSEDLLYRRELERWRGRFDLEVHVTVDRALRDWRGHVGVVTLLVHRAPCDPDNTVAMVCGPEVMMRFAATELQKRGVARERLFLSMERNMKCAVGFCGHCQFGPRFICKDGPVVRFDAVHPWIEHREI